MTNEEFYSNVLKLMKEKFPEKSVFSFQKECKGTVENTFLSMFRNKSTPRLEYILSISHALDVSSGELLEPESSTKNLTPMQIEIMKKTEGQDIATMKRILMAIDIVLGTKQEDK